MASKFGKVEKFAQVVHAMRAQLEEEIDLVEGQTVRITEVIDKDWWRGEVDGRSGHQHNLLLFAFCKYILTCITLICLRANYSLLIATVGHSQLDRVFLIRTLQYQVTFASS